MRTRTLLVVGLIVFVAVLALNLPASLLVSRLPPSITLEEPYGSIFSGGAAGLTANGTPLGALEWTFRPLSLLGLAPGYHVVLTAPNGRAEGDVAWRTGGRLALDALHVDLPLETISAAAGQPVTLGGRGRVQATLRHAELNAGWPVAVDGQLTLGDLVPPMLSQPIGSFVVAFPAPAAPADGALHARVSDAGGPLGVTGDLALKPDRTYVLEGRLTLRPGAPADLSQALAMLGTPDARGERPFSIGGTY